MTTGCLLPKHERNKPPCITEGPHGERLSTQPQPDADWSHGPAPVTVGPSGSVHAVSRPQPDAGTTRAGKALLDDFAPIEAWKDSVMRATQRSVRDSAARDIAAIEDEARHQERERLIALVEALPTLIGWVKWDEALVPTAPPYVARSAVLSILREEDS